MDKKNFDEFLLEIGLHFAEPMTNELVEKAYDKVRKIKAFNGVKKITEEDESDIKAVISSSDNILRAEITNEDVSFVIRNAKLSKEFDRSDIKFKVVLKQIASHFKSVKFDQVRATGIMYSTKEVDQSFLKSKLIKDDYIPKLDTFDVGLYYENEIINGSDGFLSLKVTDSPIGVIHQVFHELEKEDGLDGMTTVLSAHGMADDINETNFASFIDFAFSKDVTKSVLEKLGYGE